MRSTLNMKVLEDVAHDELAGTGLAFAVVVWRPGFMKRGDDVAYGSRHADPTEVADALMKATDQIIKDGKPDV